MAFEIHDLIALRGGSLYVPTEKFSASEQVTKDEYFKTMRIANVCIHVKE